MILVDTSVWVDFLRGRTPPIVSRKDLLLFRSCGPVVQEVLQGLYDDSRSNAFRQDFLALQLIGDPIGITTCMHAADLYQQGRRKGYTVRSSIDCLIAAIAIENHATVWHRDRDFETIARYTSLAAVKNI